MVWPGACLYYDQIIIHICLIYWNWKTYEDKVDLCWWSRVHHFFCFSFMILFIFAFVFDNDTWAATLKRIPTSVLYGSISKVLAFHCEDAIQFNACFHFLLSLPLKKKLLSLHINSGYIICGCNTKWMYRSLPNTLQRF